MSRPITLFSGYSQPENRATNYCLLILKMLYEENPKFLAEALSTLVGEDLGERLGVKFRQQEKRKKSTPDGLILQPAFTIYIETKNFDWFYDDQLARQKERLLNLAISGLPSECRKGAWLHCDIFFQNPAWLVHTSKLLDHFALVQPFQKVVYPAKGDISYSSDSITFTESFGSAFSSGGPTKQLTGDFRRHGHTGFAWAARRDLLMSHGLYEACVAGDGDH